MLALETDADTIASGTFVKNIDDRGESEATSVRREQEFARIAQSRQFNDLLSAFPKDNISVIDRAGEKAVQKKEESL
jgi:hypothetical protein